MTFTLSNYKNVDSTVIPIIDEFYRLRDSGDNVAAFQYAKDNEKIWKPCGVNCESFNKIELGIYDLAKEIFYSQRIIIQKEQPDVDAYKLNEGSEWLKEY